MSLRCLFGKHDFRPAKSFSQPIQRLSAGKYVDDVIVVFHGYKCSRCMQKKLVKDKDCDRSWANATERAYAWIQSTAPDNSNPTMLKVVQK